MADIKKVIYGLECRINGASYDCPYNVSCVRPDRVCNQPACEDELMNDALELLKQFAKGSSVPGKNVGQWIRTKDRLPEYNEIMLISDGKNVGIGDYDQLWGAWVNKDYDGTTVTHWMQIPRPAPPKEG